MRKKTRQEILTELQISDQAYDGLLRDFSVAAVLHIQKFKACLAAENFDGAANVLHTLKGASANLRLADIVVRIEALGGELKGAKQPEKLAQELEFLVQAIDQIET